MYQHFEFSRVHRRRAPGLESTNKGTTSAMNLSVSPTLTEGSSTSLTSMATPKSDIVRPGTISNRTQPKSTEYTAAWICALPEEFAAAKGILDEVFKNPKQERLDENVYVVGRMAHVKTVIVCLPYRCAGTTSATRVAEQMRQTFRTLQYTLLVGVAGGMPSAKADIRLGDVVVSVSLGESPAVVQYDYGKEITNGFIKITSHLNRPPDGLLKGISLLEARRLAPDSGETFPIESSIASLERDSQESWSHPGSANDILFKSTYQHEDECSACAKCDVNYLEHRPQRGSTQPEIHYGPIASANRVMRDGICRERVRQDTKALCVEMEAAGLMDISPCLVIRGICDYADSHKNKEWQRYAAATAATYAKQLLSVMPEYS